jgi:ParB family transcriptional regulator, chromosome partitioning protein
MVNVLDNLRNNRSRPVVAGRPDELTISAGVIPEDVALLRIRIAELEKLERTLYVDPSLIDRSPFQPRKYFDAVEQDKLTASIEEFGVLENLIVRVVAPGRYELVAGERRLLSVIAANKEVPIKVMELSDRDARRIALAENLNRVDLNPIEETWAILNLLAIELEVDSIDAVKSILYSLKHIIEDRKSGHNVMPSESEDQKSGHNVMPNENYRNIVEGVLAANLKGMGLKSFVSNRLPLLDLPDDISDAIGAGLEYTKALAISKLQDPEQRADLLLGVGNGMSLTDIKKQIKSLNPAPEPKERTPKDRVRATLSQVSKLKVWEDESRWTEVENLLSQIDRIINKTQEEG